VVCNSAAKGLQLCGDGSAELQIGTEKNLKEQKSDASPLPRKGEALASRAKQPSAEPMANSQGKQEDPPCVDAAERQRRIEQLANLKRKLGKPDLSLVKKPWSKPIADTCIPLGPPPADRIVRSCDWIEVAA
jgi:hypothetical protein